MWEGGKWEVMEGPLGEPFLRTRHGQADGVSCHGGDEKKGACGVSVRVGRKTQHAPCFQCCELRVDFVGLVGGCMRWLAIGWGCLRRQCFVGRIVVCHWVVSQLSLAKFVGGLVLLGPVDDIEGGGRSYGQFWTVWFVGE